MNAADIKSVKGDESKDSSSRFAKARVKEYEEILEQLGSPELISDWERFEALSKRKAHLEKIIEMQKELEELMNKIEENKAIISAREEQDLVQLAESETAQLQDREKQLKVELKNLLLGEKKIPEYKSLIVEIRAGTGGEEAGLFAADLFRMYSKYAQSAGWKQSILDSSPTEIGGFKEIVFELSGENVFSKMRSEAGVHRVQRIPKTEKSGRVHTSTVSVAVLPKPKKGKIAVNPADLKTDTYKASGPGGQYVNKRMTAVRITHLPSGLVVTSQTERSLLQNKENALSILEAKLLEQKTTAEEQKISGKRREQIGGAKRAEKIRTYNFPQDRVTDHRLKKSWHNLEEVMEGKLEPMVEALRA
ncbi:MAG: peptide chain release factor 1 [Parcubacteria group bacterium Gr01-1014_30]|nr:MAG: peptide chain release factor 1 [Parcubacteria group bacterium Gr01-1014_30]